MRMTDYRQRYGMVLRTLVLAALPFTALAAAPNAALAQENDSGDFFKTTLGGFLGLNDDEKPQIQYRERAPLVVPPPNAATTLPPPRAGGAAANPNWPKDPDVIRAQQAKAGDKTPVGLNDPSRVLLPSQLNNAKHKPTQSVASGAPVGAESKRDVLMPNELGFKSWFGVAGSNDKLTFNGEPERQELTEPPPGYQTPSPNAPYGVVEQKEEPFKFPTLFDRQ
ncbi:hypothetical protein V5F77_14345 [Xanthobacter sp. DSM 24535]|uniref:hypothetical protein n=1 Tax=Roseixanthobacter psychrophilus TaxID=3119917 RepID=UPI003728043E